VSIECKKTKKTPSIAELNQSRANAYGTTLPVVIWCPHGVGHKKSMLMCDFDDFLAWYENIAGERLANLREQEAQNVRN
jgi:hypothetical protein